MLEPAWGVVEVTGRDAARLLQGQLTRDVYAAGPGLAPLAAWCTPKGRVLTVLRLLTIEAGHYRLVMPADILEPVASLLRRYVLRDDVHIEALPEEWRVGVVEAAQADSAAQALQQRLPSEPERSVTDGRRWLVALPAPLPGCELLGPADALATLDLPPDFASRRLSCGLPTVHAATQEEFLPQMLNLDLLGAISPAKGCYVGQEVIARTQNLGRVKRRMQLFTIPQESAPSPGSPLYADGEACGKAAAVVAPLLLAVVPLERIGARFSLDAEGVLPLARGSIPYPIPEMTGTQTR